MLISPASAYTVVIRLGSRTLCVCVWVWKGVDVYLVCVHHVIINIIVVTSQ